LLHEFSFLKLIRNDENLMERVVLAGEAGQHHPQKN
jgi:hypothetical protein